MIVRDLTTCNLYAFVFVVPLKHVYMNVSRRSVWLHVTDISEIDVKCFVYSL